MATHSSVLAWRIPGTREPGELPSMGSHRVGHDWSDLAAAAAAGDIEGKGKLAHSSSWGCKVRHDWETEQQQQRAGSWNSSDRFRTEMLPWVFPLMILNSSLCLHVCCSVVKSCPTLCDPMDYSMPGSSVLRYPPEFAQIHVHWVSDALLSSHPLSPLLLLPLIFPSIRVWV